MSDTIESLRKQLEHQREIIEFVINDDTCEYVAMMIFECRLCGCYGMPDISEGSTWECDGCINK